MNILLSDFYRGFFVTFCTLVQRKEIFPVHTIVDTAHAQNIQQPMKRKDFNTRKSANNLANSTPRK